MEAPRGETRAARFDAKHNSATGHLAGDAQVEREFMRRAYDQVKSRTAGSLKFKSDGIDLFLS